MKMNKHFTCREKKITHSFFSLPLVRLDLQLEFIHQLLQTHQVLLVLLRLKTNTFQLIGYIYSTSILNIQI